jgi:hypothetical protein
VTPSEPLDPPAREAATWTVYRQDDNGNRFVVERHLSQADAERLAAEFEARGHKQFYWAEPDSD